MRTASTVVLGSACARGVLSTPADRAAAAVRVAQDSVRGVVAVSGPAPHTIVTVTTPTGAVFAVVGGDSAATPLDELRAADHLEVVVRGDVLPSTGERPDARGLRMAAFEVRAVDGVPAVDGLLERTPGGYQLRLADGRALKLAALPAPLAGQVGARIFWVGPANAPPTAYGMLRQPTPRLPSR